MRTFQSSIAVTLLVLVGATGLRAQQTPTPFATAFAPVPRLVWFSGTFQPADGQPPQSVETVTVAVYRDREGGEPVWQETQTVPVRAGGRYDILLGSTTSDGMPLDLFTAGEPRWIGVRVLRGGESEQPRVHLASVPYALKAADADTLGGKPASAYVLAEPLPSGTAASASAITHRARSAAAAGPLTAGTAGYLGMFVDSTNLGNSSLFQSGGYLGQGTTAPKDAMHVAFTDAGGVITGYAVQNLSGAANAYSGMLFYDQNGALGQFQGFNNTTHEYRINNIASGGTFNFLIGSSSKFKVANNGNIGLGVASPTSKLDVAGDINATGTLKMLGSTVLQIPGGLSDHNVGLGFNALANTTGSGNTASGADALSSSTIGFENTATGSAALGDNTTGSRNTATGAGALFVNTTGSNNTATGDSALFFNTTGNNNIAIGLNAANNVANGNSNNIHIGSGGASADSGTIRIGTGGTHNKLFAAGVRGITTGNNDAVPVLIDSGGQLGTVSSSRRFKEDIQDMGDASRGLMRLRPVTFRYRQAFADGSKPIQYGLIAEEVADVYPDLVAHSADGQIETVKYQLLDVMLLNEVQRQQAEIQALKQQNQDLQRRLERLEAAKSAGAATRR
jgi:hypothetical protein